MLYSLPNGRQIDTARQCSFEERNFLQKMVIHSHLGMDPQAFRTKWQNPANPAWQGPGSLDNPSPALLILMDLQRRLEEKP